MAASIEVGASQAVPSFECFSTLIDRNQGPAASFTEQQEYISTLHLTKFSKAKPLDMKLLHSLNHTKSSLKTHVRSGVVPDARRHYWRACLKIKDEDVVTYSKALGQNTSDISKEHGLPSSIEVPCYSQKPIFPDAIDRVLAHTSVYKSSHCPLLPVIAHVLLHILEEWECYVGLQCVLIRQGWVDRTPVECVASLLTLGKLVSSHLRSVDLSPLKPVGMGDTMFVMEFFSQWYLWPFTTRFFWFTIRVMDLYLIEGPKVLYRLALSAVRMFKKSDMFYSTTNGEIALSNIMTYYLSTLTLEELCEMVKDSLHLPRLKSETIFKLWLENCSVAESMTSSSGSGSCSPIIEATSGDNVASKQKITRTLSCDPVTEILDKESCQCINQWLPDWVQGNTLKCLFQASKHGYNLRTLYRKCDDFDSVVLVVKSMEDSVFGTIIVGDLKERHNNTFFGSGETVLFSLKPDPVCYKWTSQSDLILRANDEELIVGSGGGQFGLWIDGDLNRGSTASCSSYNNEPLTGNQKVDFKCAGVEVFCVVWDD